tara:strand:- start:2750 stop:3283 length:534 start_codon:yes stop_codon:yes gene_type:complete
MKTMKAILMSTSLVALIILSACNGNQQNEHGDHNHEHHEEMQADENHDNSQMENHQDGMGWERNAEHQEHEHKMSAQGETGNYAVGDQVPTRQVCMVNDAYMAKDQIPVPVNGKTYYGCCQMCVKTLNEQETARMATDPNTGEKVDKTEAYIALLNEDGAVGYFKTEENYLDYKENR